MEAAGNISPTHIYESTSRLYDKIADLLDFLSSKYIAKVHNCPNIPIYISIFALSILLRFYDEIVSNKKPKGDQSRWDQNILPEKSQIYLDWSRSQRRQKEHKLIEILAVNPVEALQEFWQMKVLIVVIIWINPLWYDHHGLNISYTPHYQKTGRPGGRRQSWAKARWWYMRGCLLTGDISTLLIYVILYIHIFFLIPRIQKNCFG